MKTIVLHPLDPTTYFLSGIYKDKDWTIVRNNISKSHLRKLIKEHDRIIMLGHGTEHGLIGFDKYFIDSRWVQQLREKKIVAIWCNADKFVNKYKLHGFYTGMIISEYEEALIYCVNATTTDINESNKIFTEAIHKSIDADNMLVLTKQRYEKDDNLVIGFNRENLYNKV